MGKTKEVLPIVTEHEKEKLETLEDLLNAIEERDALEYREVVKSDGASRIKWQLDLINKGTNTNWS